MRSEPITDGEIKRYEKRGNAVAIATAEETVWCMLTVGDRRGRGGGCHRVEQWNELGAAGTGWAWLQGS